jgi:cystathionine beta-synthase
VWGIDTYGSVFKKYHETGVFDEKEIYPYITEGIGEDILPKNVDFDVIDYFEKVTDKDGAVMARRLAREEGILLGYSAGSALAGLHQLKDKLTKDDVVVVVIHDHGSRYVGKIYNDDWMRERGFLEEELSVRDLLRKKGKQDFIAIHKDQKVGEALELMRQHDISQMPVVEKDEIVGSLTESNLLNYLLDNPTENGQATVHNIMGEAFPMVDEDIKLSQLRMFINKKINAVLVKDKAGKMHIVTQYDILQAM